MIDPITLSAIAQGITGGVQAIQGFSDRKRAKDMLYGKKVNGERQGGLMDAALPELQTPDMYNKLYNAAVNSKAFQAEKQAADQRFSNIVNSLGSGRERMAAVTGASRQNQSDIANAANRQFQMEQQAGMNLANAQFQTNQFNTQAQINKQNMDKQIALGGYQAGTETGLAGLGSGLQGFGMAGYDISLGKDGKRGWLDDWQRLNGTKVSSNEVNDTELPSNEEGGILRTNGEFDHDSNPKYVVNQDGEPEAEVTGDETLVFNPEQREFMKEIMYRLIKEGEIKRGDIDQEEVFEAFQAFMR